jgi:hypothetical protein
MLSVWAFLAVYKAGYIPTGLDIFTFLFKDFFPDMETMLGGGIYTQYIRVSSCLNTVIIKACTYFCPLC